MKSNLVSTAIWFAILTTSFYLVSRNLPPIVGSFRFFWAPLVMVLILLSQPKTFANYTFRIILLYGVLLLGVLQYTLWHNMLKWDRSILLEEFYTIVIFTTITNFYLARNDFRGIAIVGKLSFLFIIGTIILSHIALTIDPLVIRQSASPINFTPLQARVFKYTGAAGYGYMQALVCIIPILIFQIKHGQRMVLSRSMLVVVVVAILLLHVRAQVFANIIVAIIVTVLSLIGAKKPKGLIIPMVLIIICIIAIPTTFFETLSIRISSLLNPESYMSYKLNDFTAFIQNPELNSNTGVGNRAERYPMLLDAFMANPLFGNASYNSMYDTTGGGHLHWMNKLSSWGLLGFSFYIFVLFKIYKSIRTLFDDRFGLYYFLSVMAFVLLGFMKTIAGREPFLMLIVVIPGLYFLPVLKHKPSI